MADRPILFSGPMVRALLDGRKTQTRRVLTKLTRFGTINEFGSSDTRGYDWHFRDGQMRWHDLRHADLLKVLPYTVGDRLYVREAWRCNGWASDVATIFYRASEGDGYTAMCEQYPVADKQPLRVTTAWRPGIHMPRWASRLTLIVADVRVQRLQEISEADAIAKGIQPCGVLHAAPEMPMWGVGTEQLGNTQIAAFSLLWDRINEKRGYGWDENPWVVAVTFTVHHQNIGAMEVNRG